MTEAWIETFTGLKFDVLEPQPEQIRIEDIAHSLSMLCRFTGHCKWLYTVGQHSYVGSFLVPPVDALHFLLHDASEAFIGDLNRPTKHLTTAGDAYRLVEDRIQRTIYRRFGLSEVEPPSVKLADNAMLYAEKEQLMAPIEWTHDWGCSTNPANVVLNEMQPREVERLFLDRFKFLTDN